MEKDNKINILIFSIAYHPFVGGAEVAIKEISDRINDVHFDMITLRFDSELPAFERIGNVDVYRIGFGRKRPTTLDLVSWPLKLNKILFPFLAFFKALSLGRQKRYDIVWAMMAAYAGFAAMFYKLYAKHPKFLLSLQEGDPIDEIKEKVRYVYPLFKLIFSKADIIQVISRHLGDYARGMGYQGKLEVIPNGVDIERFRAPIDPVLLENLKSKYNKKPGDVFLISTSRLVKKNAYDDIMQALTLLPASVRLLVVGDGPDKDYLEEIVSELKLGDRVIFLGFQPQSEIPALLRISDIFVRPSLSEGLGNSFLEAMAAGLPVIATPVGGIPDFLFDPETNPGHPPTGLFCQPKDPKSIAKQVKRLIDDPGLEQVIIKNGQEMVIDSYDWKIISLKMRELFDSHKH